MMRKVVRDRLKDKSLPLVSAHGGGGGLARENSIDAIRAALPYKPDLIEVDVRKSADGVLYCHHGSVPFGVSAAKLHRFLPFRHIQLFTGKRSTLRDVLAVIPDDIGVFLDIKDKRITAEDLRPLISGRDHVWVCAYTLRHLRSLRKGLGDEFCYSLNRPLLRVRHGIGHVEGVADAVNAFVWQWNAKTRQQLEAAGIMCAYVQVFTPITHRRFSGKLAPGLLMHVYDDPSKTHRSS